MDFLQRDVLNNLRLTPSPTPSRIVAAPSPLTPSPTRFRMTAARRAEHLTDLDPAHVTQIARGKSRLFRLVRSLC